MEINKKIKLCMISIFLIILWLPLFQMQSHLFPESEMNEKRKKNPKPKFTISSIRNGNFMNGFEKYYNDNIGFRNLLVKIANTVDVKVFNVSPNPSVIIGENGYLYYADAIKDYNKITLTDSELSRLADKMKELQDKLEKRGVNFLFLVGPNKNTIYPEYMPFPSSNPSGKSNYQKLINQLKVRNVNIIDTASLLIAQKQNSQLYFKRGTHWNYVAGLMISQEILSNLGRYEGINPSPKALSFPVIDGPDCDNGLDGMMGVESPESKYVMPEVDYGDAVGKLSKVVWFHDSFSDALFYVNPYFSQMIKLHIGENSFGPSLLSNINGTKYVVFEVVERNIPGLIYRHDFDVFDNSLDIMGSDYVCKNLDPGIAGIAEIKVEQAEKSGWSLYTQGLSPRLFWDYSESQLGYVYIEFVQPPPQSIGKVWWFVPNQDQTNPVSQNFIMHPGKTKYLVKLDDVRNVKLIRIDFGEKPGLAYNVKRIEAYGK